MLGVLTEARWKGLNNRVQQQLNLVQEEIGLALLFSVQSSNFGLTKFAPEQSTNLPQWNMSHGIAFEYHQTDLNKKIRVDINEMFVILYCQSKSTCWHQLEIERLANASIYWIPYPWKTFYRILSYTFSVANVLLYSPPSSEFYPRSLVLSHLRMPLVWGSLGSKTSNFMHGLNQFHFQCPLLLDLPVVLVCFHHLH